jgi:protein-tyrosine phosphatase
MGPALHLIAWPGPGRLATMAHPRGGSRLADDMAGLAEAGVDVLVSTLTGEEQRRLGLLDAAPTAAAAGVDFMAFPIEDRGVPEGPAVVAVAVRLAAHMRAGRFVAVHCFGAIGRAPLLAGATLAVLGVDPAEALRLIASARGLPVPATTAQRDWLFAFAAHLRS